MRVRASIAIFWSCFTLGVLMTTATAQDGAACSAPEHRQFDFWLGEWEVRNPAGDVVGTNRVVEVLGGCAIQENWEGTGGVVGSSYNSYYAPLDIWHQTWVDSQGSLLRLEGGFADGTMVMRGTTPAREDPTVTVHHRLSWSNVEDDPDRVRQLWEVSMDGGESWRVIFDGLYVRME